jgi:hypothetical protein
MLLLATCTAVLGCAPRGPAPSWPHEGTLLHEEAGVAIAVPPNWLTTRSTTGMVAGGEPGTPAYYTTLSIQALRPPAKATFAELLRAAYEHPAITDNYPAAMVPCVADDALGACYAVSFTLFAEPRRRVGVLIDLGSYVVDVAFTAPAADFADHVDVFERVLATLTIEPAG